MMRRTVAAIVGVMAFGGVLIATDVMAGQHSGRSNVADGNAARAAGGRAGVANPARVGHAAGVNRGASRNAGYRGQYGGNVGHGRGYGYGAAGVEYAPAYGYGAADVEYAPAYGYGADVEYAPAYGYGYENGGGSGPCLPVPVPVIGCM